MPVVNRQLNSLSCRREKLPSLEEQVKTIRVKNPITQEFHGTHGTYTQANIEKQRSYNLPQWKALCEESNHQPPAKRGERRANQEKVVRGPSKRSARAPAPLPTPGAKRRPGRPFRTRGKPVKTTEPEEGTDSAREEGVQVPPTPTSPIPPKSKRLKKEHQSDEEDVRSKGRQPKSVSSRRQHNTKSQADIVDEEAFRGFDYRVYNQEEWTTERIQELETAYWKSLTFNNPMYGADMPGSLFDDRTKDWNVAKLENLLDVLGQKVPGVNTAYLYLGMWKASFAWHLEDVDLYSINYIHFGAPKQWYSISQADARRFEGAMRAVWPSDAKNCDQFLRHKTYLISPQLLQSQYNIRVNRLVHNEGEFVITFPYGYHSGYNLGYNCAESVNFATESWLDYGRIAKKCNCEADSVWVDVHDIERKLRGEPTPEYYEETDDDDDEEDDDGPTDLPTPPGSVKNQPKRSHHKKKATEKASKPKVKKLRIRLKAPTFEPCVLCPNDNKRESVIPTDNGQMAHRRCGIYTPETYLATDNGIERVCNVAGIEKARLELKCFYCRSRKGAVFQCSEKKCAKAYHATCAAQAGVLVDIGEVAVFAEDGTEYIDEGIDFRCKIHRGKRGKNQDGGTLEENVFIRKQASRKQVGETVQAQFPLQEIFAGVVIENRKDEETLLLEILPTGQQFEVEYKYLLILDPLNSKRSIPTENAKPMPAELRYARTTAEAPLSAEDPRPGDAFCDPKTVYKWCEFIRRPLFKNTEQVKIEVDKPEKIWHYLGRISTEAKPSWSHDPNIEVNNIKGNYLETIRLANLPPVMPPVRRSLGASYPGGTINQNAINAARANSQSSQNKPAVSKARPYHGKYAITDPVHDSSLQYRPTNKFDPNGFQPRSAQTSLYGQSTQAPQYHHHNYNGSTPGTQTVPKPQSTPSATAFAHGQYPSPQPYQKSSEYGYNYNFNVGHTSLLLPFMPLNASADSLQRTPQAPTSQAPERPGSARAWPQAPVANMMGNPPPSNSSTNTESHTKSRTPSSPFLPQPPSEVSRRQSLNPDDPSNSPTAAVSPAPLETKGFSNLNVDLKYHYLHEAEKSRPPIYQSPYAAGGGITTAWLPLPEAPVKTRPRGPSISEAFLSRQDRTHQEEVARKMSEDKVRLQQENHDRVQRRLSQSQARPFMQIRPQSQFQPLGLKTDGHMPPQHLPLSAIEDSHPSKIVQSSHAHGNYYDPLPTNTYPSYSDYGTTYASGPYQGTAHSSGYNDNTSGYVQNPLPHRTQPYYNTSPYSPAKPSGLQFSSPQDFRLQMEHANQRPQIQDQGYDRFWPIQTAVTGGQRHGHSADIGGGQGSPLKYEMGGAAETLPMMRDGSHQRL